MADEEKEISVHIYSDVDSGDWRAEIESDEGKTELSGADQSTAIDLVAATATLSYLYEHYKGRKVKIYTKSEYLKKGITRWIKRWRHNGWLTKDNKPVSHKEHWENLYALYDSECMKWCLVKNEPAEPKKKIGFVAYTIGISDSDGNGTWRATIIDENGEKTGLSGSATDTSGKRMALEAATQALRFICDNGGGKAKVYAEDEWVKNGITGWIFSWKRNNWLKKDNTPVLHKELWQELDELNNSLSIVWCQGKKPEDIKAELKQLQRSKKHKKTGQVNLSLLNPEICAPADAKTFVITEEWLRANTNFGAVNAKQLKAIGLSWPPKNGWLQNMVGKVISIEEKLKFERYKKNTKKIEFVLDTFCVLVYSQYHFKETP